MDESPLIAEVVGQLVNNSRKKHDEKKKYIQPLDRKKRGRKSNKTVTQSREMQEEPASSTHPAIFNDNKAAMGKQCLTLDFINKNRESCTSNSKNTFNSFGVVTYSDNELVEARKRKKRRLRAVSAESLYDIQSGFEINRNRDPSQLLYAQPSSGGAPRGWCQKYWWDEENPIEWINSGGMVLSYSPNHREVINKVNTMLHISLKDEGRITKHTEPTDSQSLECIKFKYQLYRDSCLYAPEHSYSFSSFYSSRQSLTEHTSPTFTPEISMVSETTKFNASKESDGRQSHLASCVPSSSRHRLLDPKLFSELKRQQHLRQLCQTNLQTTI